MLTTAQFKELVGSKFFSITFYKKDGTKRTMNGRLGVTKYVKGTGKPKPNSIVTVYEVNKRQYRSFDISRLISVKTKGNEVIIQA